MINLQVTQPNEITKVNEQNNLERLDDVKVKITKCFITRKDIADFMGASKRPLPFTPSQIAVGQITETLQESNYFTKGTKVYLNPMTVSDLPDDAREKGLCAFDGGFLKDFTVINKEYVHILPNNVLEADALYLYHIALALSVIDTLNFTQGEYVAVIGGTTLANIIAQLISYYKAVPILIDNNEQNLELAYKNDVYYTLKTNKTLEQEILSITGGRKCPKIVYTTDSDIDVSIIDKVSASKAHCAITGIYDCKQKLPVSICFNKQLKLNFIKSGYNNVTTAINLLVQKAVKLEHFKLPEYKFEYVQKQFENSVKKLQKGENPEFTVDLL